MKKITIALALLVYTFTTQLVTGATAPSTRSVAALSNRSCPSSFPIKVKFKRVSSGLQCAYVVPGAAFYDEFVPERCYATLMEAKSDGCMERTETQLPRSVQKKVENLPAMESARLRKLPGSVETSVEPRERQVDEREAAHVNRHDVSRQSQERALEIARARERVAEARELEKKAPTRAIRVPAPAEKSSRSNGEEIAAEAPRRLSTSSGSPIPPFQEQTAREPESVDTPVSRNFTEDPFALVDRALGQLKKARIAFNAPQSMKLGDTVTVQLLLNMRKTIEELSQQITAEGTKTGVDWSKRRTTIAATALN